MAFVSVVLVGTLVGPLPAATAATLPGPPQDVRGLSTDAQAEHVRVGWSPPADDGGARITAYEIQASTDGVAWSHRRFSECDPTPDPSCPELTTVFSYELDIYATYFFRVAAYNAAGWGPWSELSPPFTVLPGNRPRVAPPSDVTAKPVLQGIHVAWHPPADAVDVSYEVQWSRDGTRWRSAWTRSTSYAITGLDFGYYDVRVRTRRWEVEYSVWSTVGPVRVPDRRQRIKGYDGLPRALWSPGTTVLVPCGLTTNAGQPVRVRVDWKVDRALTRGDQDAVTVKRRPCGKVKVILDGTPVIVTVRLSAPAVGRFTRLLITRTYRPC